MRVILFVLALLSMPAAAAQNLSDEPPDPDESLEDTPGIFYGSAVVIGMVLFILVLAFASWREHRRGPGSPPRP